MPYFPVNPAAVNDPAYLEPRLSAAENNINILNGKLSQADRQTQTLSHGVSVVNAETSSPLKVEFYGNTLVNLGNSILQSGKYYVMPNKKMKVKFADATTFTTKFAGKSEKPSIIRIANFEGKVSGSVVDNPHTYKRSGNSGLTSPSSFTAENDQTSYSQITSLNGVNRSYVVNINGGIAQELFSFNLIEEVERQIGKIPKATVADKVQWLKDNLAKLTCNWHGSGSSVGGNKANFTRWGVVNSIWHGAGSVVTHTNASITKLVYTTANIVDSVDVNGFVHFIAYADPSDGVTPSTINTDYVDLEIELKPTADIWNPKVPLYEVDQSTYDKIGVSLTDADVERMFPYVDGVQHVKNPVVKVEGENLLPPFSEWALHANVKVLSPYELELNPNGDYQTSFYELIPITGQSYTFSVNTKGYINSTTKPYLAIERLDENKKMIAPVTLNATVDNEILTITYTAVTTDRYLRFAVGNRGTTGKFTFTNPILSLGSTAKPFVPRNPSYLFADVKLGQIGDKKDILSYNEDKRRWEKTKWWEVDKVLDGSYPLEFHAEHAGFKRIRTKFYDNPSVYTFGTKYNGGIITQFVTDWKIDNVTISEFGGVKGYLCISISNSDSGWTEAMTPSADLIKSYFYGWKYKGDGTTHSWVSLVDGSAPAENTLAYVSKNKAPNFTPYKLTYQLAKPVVEEVNVEGDLVVNGLTQVEVTSGVIVRERVVPYNSGSAYHINNTSYSQGLLKNKSGGIIAIYKNTVKDTKWISSVTSANGKDRVYIATADFDPTAEYTVSYLVLDRHQFTTNATEVKATYAKNIRSALDDVVSKQSDVATTVSVNVRAIVDLYARLKAGGL